MDLTVCGMKSYYCSIRDWKVREVTVEKKKKEKVQFPIKRDEILRVRVKYRYHVLEIVHSGSHY